jgi:hypothetical protein
LHNPRRPHCFQDAGWKSVDELIPKRVFFIGRLLDEESSSALLCALKSIKLLRLDDSNLFSSPIPSTACLLSHIRNSFFCAMF